MKTDYDVSDHGNLLSCHIHIILYNLGYPLREPRQTLWKSAESVLRLVDLMKESACCRKINYINTMHIKVMKNVTDKC